jgi:hypothetical protein
MTTESIQSQDEALCGLSPLAFIGVMLCELIAALFAKDKP